MQKNSLTNLGIAFIRFL